jgi:hypothetical protein
MHKTGLVRRSPVRNDPDWALLPDSVGRVPYALRSRTATGQDEERRVNLDPDESSNSDLPPPTDIGLSTSSIEAPGDLSSTPVVAKTPSLIILVYCCSVMHIED